VPRRDELLHEFDALSADSEEDVVRFRVAEGDLRHLTVADLPEVVEVEPVADTNLNMHAFEGTLCRGERTPTAAHFEMEWTPKLWEGTLGLLSTRGWRRWRLRSGSSTSAMWSSSITRKTKTSVAEAGVVPGAVRSGHEAVALSQRRPRGRWWGDVALAAGSELETACMSGTASWAN
jgi:hypothetical protein